MCRREHFIIVLCKYILQKRKETVMKNSFFFSAMFKDFILYDHDFILSEYLRDTTINDHIINVLRSLYSRNIVYRFTKMNNSS